MEDASATLTFGNTELANGTPERPLISFVLFAYNHEEYIREAIQAAVSQTYSPLEIILSDDCSSDRTFEIIREVAEEYVGQHKVIVERMAKNVGKNLYGRRIWNTLQRANGEFIVIASGDDVSFPERVERLFAIWDSNGRGRVCIHSAINWIDETGRVRGINIGTNNLASCSLVDFVRKDGRGLYGAANSLSHSLLTSFGPLSDRLLLEDGALAFRAKLCDGILFCSDPLVFYRRHASNLSAVYSKVGDEFIERFCLGLISQHMGYLSDYLSSRKNVDPDFIRAVLMRLNHAYCVMGYRDKNPLKRLAAALGLGRNAPTVRKIYLILDAIFRFKG
ncbi:glycosyltransferase [Flavimaricola sp.]|nr:glycosyltransferase [Flavimaricola sp.]MDA9020353.1 glycosyltransferase [Flavimaricola sp.]